MERAISKDRSTPSLVLTRQDAAGLLLGAFGFFLGRISFLIFLSPIAIAFLALFLGTSYQFYIVMLLTAAGMATQLKGMYLAKYLACMLVMAAVNFFLTKKRIKPDIMLKSAAGGVIILGSGLSLAAFNSMSLYFALMAVLESMLVSGLSIVLRNACKVITSTRRKKLLTNEEIASLAILFGGVASGASGFTPGGVSIGMTISISVILITGHKGGSAFGATAGMLLGITQYISGTFAVEYIIILGIAGLSAGFFREKGKAAVIIGFLIGGVMISFLMYREIFSIGTLCAAALGATLFSILPSTFYFNVGAPANTNLDSNELYLERVKEIISQRLNGFAHAFAKLSTTFRNISEKKTSLNQKDVNLLIDDVASKACRKCGMRDFCWQDSFYDTYQAVFGMLSACEKYGRITPSDIPQNFMVSCVNAGKFAEITMKIFEMYKLNMTWHNRIVESRALVSEQLSGVSEIIGALSEELDLHMDFKMDLEEGIMSELSKNRIEVENVIVLENKLGKYEVSIQKKHCFDRKQCARDATGIISNLLGRKMKRDESICNYKRGGCQIRLVEEQKYRISSGAAKKHKTGSEESGDTYTFMELRNGQCILALSDGMGSGPKALKESQATIELFEEFIESGFAKDIAVKIINSVLVLKSSEESFATLDICSIDLYNASAEFIKIGAAATYLLRDDTIHIIKSSSLPMGILPDVDLEVCSKMLKDNDIIIMVTDGITELNFENEPKGQWVIDTLQNFKGKNPQDIADYLLSEAEKLACFKPDDDMTVLVTKIWERV